MTNVNKFGYSAAEWNKAKEEMRQILIDRAKAGDMIAYSLLVSQVTAIHMNPKSMALGAMLGEIAHEEDAQGRGILTVLVIHKYGDMKPGEGFFDLARELGRDTHSLLKCWVDELKKVHLYWQEKSHL